MTTLWHSAASFLFAATAGTMSAAQTGPFGAGWELRAEASSLGFQSIKNQSSIETSSFATKSGAIGPDGAANLKILLESLDTKVRCPDLNILIAGHTDSVGDPNYNQRLSELPAGDG